MRLMIIALLFWFAETAYFGFHMHPSCRAESVCDQFVVTAIIFACGMNYQRSKMKG